MDVVINRRLHRAFELKALPILQRLWEIPSTEIFSHNYLAAVTLVAADMTAFLKAPSMVTAKL
jgi:hypothetical protein